MNYHCLKLFTILNLLSLFILTSCSITPVVIERQTIAYDEKGQTAGIIQDFGDQERSSEITPSARDRYNNLILSQEGLTSYLSKRDFGITPLPNGNYKITGQGKEYWYELKLNARDVTK